MQERPRTMVVAGATGYIGGHIARAMHDAGYLVRALARDAQDPRQLGNKFDELFVGQAASPGSLKGLCDGADVVISSLGLRTLRSRPSPEAVDYQANLNILKEAELAGVRHFIFISVMHGEELAPQVPILRAREKFVRRLKDSGMTWTVLRPTGSFNDMSEIFRIARSGWGMVLGEGRNRMNPVHPADIASVAVRAVRDPALRDSEFSFGGPDIYTSSEISRLALCALGKRPRVVRVPYWPVDALAFALRPVNRNAAGLLSFFRQTQTRDMVGVPVGEHHLWDLYLDLAGNYSAHP